MLARWINEHWDWSEIERDWFRHRGILPAELRGMTPFELIAVLGGPDEGEVRTPALTPEGDLARLNHVKRAGQMPVIPGWLMKKVPRESG